MTPQVQNLNAKLSPRPRKSNPRVAATNRHLARATTPPHLRATSAQTGYRGGYCIDV